MRRQGTLHRVLNLGGGPAACPAAPLLLTRDGEVVWFAASGGRGPGAGGQLRACDINGNPTALDAEEAAAAGGDRVNAAALSADGRVLFSASGSVVDVRPVRTLRACGCLPAAAPAADGWDGPPPTALALSTCGGFLFVGLADGAMDITAACPSTDEVMRAAAETLQMCARIYVRASGARADVLNCERACVRADGRAGGRACACLTACCRWGAGLAIAEFPSAGAGAAVQGDEGLTPRRHFRNQPACREPPAPVGALFPICCQGPQVHCFCC